MTRKAKVPAKAEPKKPKGPDNNKRLAVLEAKEAAAKATNADTVITTGEAIKREEPISLSQEYPLQYDAGRRARGAAIARDQMPAFFNDGERDAWLEGYDSQGERP